MRVIEIHRMQTDAFALGCPLTSGPDVIRVVSSQFLLFSPTAPPPSCLSPSFSSSAQLIQRLKAYLVSPSLFNCNHFHLSSVTKPKSRLSICIHGLVVIKTTDKLALSTKFMAQRRSWSFTCLAVAHIEYFFFFGSLSLLIELLTSF